ncbi:MAG: 2OG-Fe(II) oxygenase family protein, partial [Steroidobacteraceae bacterium]
VVNAVNDFTEVQLRSFAPQVRGWFTVVKPDGGVPAINYPLAAWCAIYCVAAPELSATRRDSGILRLYESRFGTMFADATTSGMRLPFRPGHYGWRPVPGQLAVFPASLTHEIAPVRSPEHLMLVTACVRFVAPGQQGVTRW